MRLIDADKLNDVLINISEHLQHEGTVVSGPMHKFYEHFMEIVKGQATVDPIKHGRWIDTGYYGYHHMLIVQCSECKNELEGSLNDEFCPRCGAKMDLQEGTWSD